MFLNCPRCTEQIEIDPNQAEHAICPKCSARLRLRRTPKSSEPAAPSPEPTPEAGGASSSSDASSAPAPKQPAGDVTLPASTRLGGFEIRKVVGRGGMATVYRGVQLSLNRPVAVKVLAPRFAKNPAFVERFDREAGALANLNHPNIVNIIDKGVVDDNYYFVMELVEGITLDQLLQTVELNERHYIHIIGEISKAITYVHSRGIIHRDIKPSNVLVNKHGLVKVSDFGIAHITDAAFPPERFGKQATVGTANYMAPEQAENPGSVDVRADVYSLGVTFYKMFAKKLPVGQFKGASVHNPRIPRTVDTVLAKAMERDPDKRYQTVQELCDTLIHLFLPADSDALRKSEAEGGSEPFLFNPSLLTSGSMTLPGGRSLPREESSISLFVPTQWTATGSGNKSAPPPTPLPGGESQSPPSPLPAVAPDTPAKKRVFQVAALVIAILAVATLFVAYYLWKDLRNW